MKADRSSHPATPVAAPERLVDVLAEHWTNPRVRLVWIGAPAGSGKTTLLDTCAGQGAVHVVRLRAGPDDADPAVWLPRLASALKAIATPSATPPLALTREHLADPPAYLRRWLRGLDVAEPACVVIDDAQHASAVLEPLLRAAIDEGPIALRWLIASRDSLPAVLQRARNHGQAVEIHAGDLALTAAECEQCLAACAAPLLDRAGIEAVHAATGGWAVAVVAVAAAIGPMGPMGPIGRTAPTGGVALRPPGDIRLPEALFAYLEAEVFTNFEARALGVLVDCAWLPFVRAAWAVALSGDARAHEVFEDLARRHLLVERRDDDGATRYHPHALLVAFLRRKAESLHAPQAVRQRQTDSARLLEADGLPEVALALDLLSQRWADANRLIEQLGPPAIAQARHVSVGSWAERVPARERSAWVRFWLGQATLLLQPAQARAHLIAALDTFEPQERDAKLRALAAIVASYFQTYADTEPLATWLQRLAEVAPDTDAIDDPETRA
ncbi:MAG TPA: hypothetical protein VLJ62_03065, partial [Burkholderiaceae bacterium]|nr:hypothetical protein [Burkholderiaceae bacterium]